MCDQIAKNTVDAPLLSVIIVSYNEAKYLSCAIDSCLNQVCDFKFEIIIGDDGSDDGSLDIINDYVSKFPDKIRFFVMDRVIGKDGVIASFRASNVIKRGLKEVRGKYVNIISGDDFFCDDHYFQSQLSIFESDKKEKFSAVVADSFKMLYAEGVDEANQNIDIVQETAHHCEHLPTYIHWYSNNYNHVSCFMFRKDIAEKRLLQRFCDDVGLVFSLCFDKTWKWTSTLPFCYRQRKGSIMHSLDIFELKIYDVMFVQDCLNFGKGMFMILRTYCMSLIYVFLNKNKLHGEKYRKYINSSRMYPNDLLGMMYSWNEILFRKKIYFFSLIFVALVFKTIMDILFLSFRVVCKCKKIFKRGMN